MKSEKKMPVQRLVANTDTKIKQAVKLLRDEELLGFDSETNGLDSHVGKVWSLQFGTYDYQVLIPINGTPGALNLHLLDEVLLNPETTIIGHNLAFDMKVLWSLGLDIGGKLWCSRVAEALLSAGLFGNNSLSGVLKRYFNLDMSKEERDDFYKDVDGGIALDTGKKTVFEASGCEWTPELVDYALDDVKYLPLLTLKQKARLAEEGMSKLAELIEMPLVRTTAAMEYRGVKINKVECLKFQNDMKTLADSTKAELIEELDIEWKKYALPIYEVNIRKWKEWNDSNRVIILETNKHRDSENKRKISADARAKRDEWKKVKPFNAPPKPPGTINLRSNPQMRVALDRKGVAVKDLRKETLQDAIAEPIIEKLVEFKKFDKLSQMSEIYEKINPATGRIHPTFNQVVDTGRYSGSKPNPQNIPIRSEEGARFRSLFEAEKGNVFVIADYSAIELVIIGAFSDDNTLLHALDNNLDLHCWTMSKFLDCSYEALIAVKEYKHGISIKNCEDGVGHSSRDIERVFEAKNKFQTKFNLPELNKAEDLVKWVKTLRDYIKTLTYGIAYGLSAFGLSRRFHCDMEEAQRFIDTFFAVYSRVKHWLDLKADFAMEFGYSKTTSGRRRYYRRPKKPTDSDIWMECIAVLKLQDRVLDSLSPVEEADLFETVRKRLWREYKQTIGRIRRQAANHPVQGTSADATKEAMVFFEVWWVPYAKKNKINYLRYGTVLTVHDELVVEVPKAHAAIVVEKLKWAMERAAKDFIGESVNIVVVPKITERWEK